MNTEWQLIDSKQLPLLVASQELQKRLGAAVDFSGSIGIRSRHPIQLSQAQSAMVSPYAQVRSELPLRLPSTTGVPAQLLCHPVDGLKNQTTYDMGDLVVALLDEQGAFLEEITIPLGPFKTFEFGRPFNQVVEYVATLCDIDMVHHGFRCHRYQNQVLFQGMPEYPGLNLKLIRQEYSPEKPIQGISLNPGLVPGLSTMDSNQIQGRAAAAVYGTYQINGFEITIQLSQRQAQDLDAAKKVLATQLNALTALTGVKANFDAQNHLVFTHTKPGTQHTIHIRNLSKNNMAEMDPLSLALPEGLFAGNDIGDTQGPETDFGQLVLNQVPIVLGKLSHLKYTSESAAQHILRCFNQKTINTGVLASLDVQRHLVLSPVREEVSIEITQLTDSEKMPLANHPLGLVEGRTANPLQEWQIIVEHLRQFVKTFNQLSTAIRTSVMKVTEAGHQARLKELEALFYEDFLTTLELHGLEMKQPFNEILGIQLSLNEKLLQLQWQAQPDALQTYFSHVATQMAQWATRYPLSTPNQVVPQAASAVGGLNIQSRVPPGGPQLNLRKV